jgi:hypothetical protein
MREAQFTARFASDMRKSYQVKMPDIINDRHDATITRFFSECYSRNDAMFRETFHSGVEGLNFKHHVSHNTIAVFNDFGKFLAIFYAI